MTLYKKNFYINSLLFLLMSLYQIACNASSSPTTVTVTNTVAATSSPAKSTLTPTASPTVSPAELNSILINLLSNNGGCQLPCLFGVEPGISWVEAEKILARESVTTSTDKSYGRLVHYTTKSLFLPNSEHSLFLKINFYETDKMIDLIHIHGGGYSNPEGLRSVWNNFSPENIISEKGIPTQIWLEVRLVQTEGNSPKAPYLLWFYYEESEMVINYEGIVTRADTLQFCPTFYPSGNLGGAINIYTGYTGDSSSVLDFREISNRKDKLIPLETIGITLKEFEILYAQEESLICFEAPASIWE